jgi:hypothetical protein
MAIAGFVCAFLLPVLGIVFSAIGLSQTGRTGERGRGLAIAGLSISIVLILAAVALYAVLAAAIGSA